ncbi:uncharacterized protein J8A68_000816 [[Candida] subhashii]|uniref:Major facilitator superfamily (MFS) profile domain-containing protein n=1 Tax=[Candida] subhashii TaxID=561895 RepID=A0A8J5QTK0_9ASCO|nr:uncharacterized protein J8A68_000816 [[Candida] subhashii]KAG7665610.1 hypothetical protein J8A68_000816 [[Candida] subhashii]
MTSSDNEPKPQSQQKSTSVDSTSSSAPQDYAQQPEEQDVQQEKIGKDPVPESSIPISPILSLASSDLENPDNHHHHHHHHPLTTTSRDSSLPPDGHRPPLHVSTEPISRTTSIATNRVPRKDRRGLLAQLVLIPEYQDARDYPTNVKYLIITIIAFASITGPMGTSIMLPAIDAIVIDLNTSTSVVNISVGIYLLSLGIFPLWWSAFSEQFGRRSVYMISFALFVAFSIGTALSPNIASLIILRVLQGGSSASVQAVGAGTIADLFIPQERGTAMGWYYLGPLMGPFLAPILGGIVSDAWGWRATQWLLVIFSGCNFCSIMFLLPETLRQAENLQAVRELLKTAAAAQHDHTLEEQEEEDKNNSHDSNSLDSNRLQPVLTNLSRMTTHSIMTALEEEGPVMDPVTPAISRFPTNRSTYSRRIQQDLENETQSRIISTISLPQPPRSKWATFKTNSYDIVIRPMHSIVLLKHPPVALVVAYSAISFAVLYFFNMTITYSYSRSPYNFREIIVGLLYIPNSVTYIIASMLGGKWNDYLLNKYIKKHGEVVPEARISWNVVVAVILLPIACLIFGWTIEYGEFWLVPLIGTALFGFATMLLITAVVTYLVDTLPGKGATGVALNNLIRLVLAAIATFIVEPLLAAIGPGILFSILMGILTVSSLVLWYLKRHGMYFRENYDISILYDKL